MMNRETSFYSSDTLVVVDRSRRRRMVIIAAVVILGLLAIGLALMMSRSASEKKAAEAASASAGQVPNVTVIVPGMSSIGRAIVASGSLEPTIRSEMLKAGVIDTIQKPYDFNDLLAKIREVIGSREVPDDHPELF